MTAHRTAPHRWSRRAACTVPLAALALGALPASPAAAVKPVIRETGTFQDAFTEPDLCGVAVDIAVEGTFRDLVLPVPGSNGDPFLLRSSETATETWTTEAGEGVVTVESRTRVVEQRAEQVLGTVYRFTTLFVVHTVFRDADGRVLLRENGSNSFQVDFDTEGDKAPGGVTVPGTFVVQRSSGNLPDQDALCAAVRPAIT